MKTPGKRLDAATALLWAYALLIYLFLYGPILVITILSFNDSPVVGFPFRQGTLRWYAIVFTSPELVRALANSILLGIVSAAIGTAMATGLALAFRHEFFGKAVLFNLVLLPIIAPAVVTAATFVAFFGMLGVAPSLWTTVLCAHVTWVLPFAFLNIYPRVHGFDRALEEAAMDLGASRALAMRRIVLPLIAPGIISGALFAFSLSFDEFVRTLFLAGYDRTLPVQFWYMVVESLAPESSALAVVIILLSVVVSLAGFMVSRVRATPETS